MATTRRDDLANRDPITGTPGSHPVGTGVGAAGGAATGAAIGAAGGPAGMLAGAAVGAIVGGLAGKGVAEAIDPTVEEAYWRDNFASRPYAAGSTFDDYAPAYRYGWETYPRHAGRSFNEVESDLRTDWDNARGESRLDWDRARHAARDSWERVGERIEHALPGDADGDGR